MLLKPIVLVTIGAAGWALGRVRPAVNVPVLVLALFAAITAHAGMQWAFLDGRLDVALGDPRTGAHAGVVLIAGGEAVGLWLPFLLLPWAEAWARLWTAVYALAAATMAAVYFYFPFDLVIISEAFVAPDGPPYLFAFFACFPIGAAGYLIGWAMPRPDRDLD